MRKILSGILAVSLIFGMSSSGFTAGVGTSIQAPAKLAEAIVVKDLKTKEGKWSTLSISMKDVQKIQEESESNVFKVKMDVTAEKFSGSASALLKNNMPIKAMGDNTCQVAYVEKTGNLFDSVSLIKNGKKTDGVLANKKAVSFTKPQKFTGYIQVRVAKSVKQPILPITLADNRKVFIKFDIAANDSETGTDGTSQAVTEPKQTSSAPPVLEVKKPNYVLDESVEYGNDQVGTFKSNLKLVEKTTKLDTNEPYDLTKAYKLKIDGDDYSSVDVFLHCYFFTNDYRAEDIELIAKEFADEHKLSAKKVGVGRYEVKGRSKDGTDIDAQYIACENFMRIIMVYSEPECTEYVASIVKNFKYDDSKFKLPSKKYKVSKGANDYFDGTFITFKSQVDLFKYNYGILRSPTASIFAASNEEWYVMCEMVNEKGDLQAAVNEFKKDNEHAVVYNCNEERFYMTFTRYEEGDSEVCVFAPVNGRIVKVSSYLKNTSNLENEKYLLTSIIEQFEGDRRMLDKIYKEIDEIFK